MIWTPITTKGANMNRILVYMGANAKNIQATELIMEVIIDRLY